MQLSTGIIAHIRNMTIEIKLVINVYTQTCHITIQIQDIITDNDVKVLCVNRFVFEEHTLTFKGIGLQRTIINYYQAFFNIAFQTTFCSLIIFVSIRYTVDLSIF